MMFWEADTGLGALDTTPQQPLDASHESSSDESEHVSAYVLKFLVDGVQVIVVALSRPYDRGGRSFECNSSTTT